MEAGRPRAAPCSRGSTSTSISTSVSPPELAEVPRHRPAWPGGRRCGPSRLRRRGGRAVARSVARRDAVRADGLRDAGNGVHPMRGRCSASSPKRPGDEPGQRHHHRRKGRRLNSAWRAAVRRVSTSSATSCRRSSSRRCDAVGRSHGGSGDDAGYFLSCVGLPVLRRSRRELTSSETPSAAGRPALGSALWPHGGLRRSGEAELRALLWRAGPLRRGAPPQGLRREIEAMPAPGADVVESLQHLVAQWCTSAEKRPGSCAPRGSSAILSSDSASGGSARPS